MLVGHQVSQVHIEHTGTASSKLELLSVGKRQSLAESKSVLGEVARAHPVLHLGTRLPLCSPSVLLVIVHGQCQADTYQWATKALRQPELGLQRQSYGCPITHTSMSGSNSESTKDWLSPALLNTRARDHSNKAEYVRFTCMEMGLILFKPLALIVARYKQTRTKYNSNWN